jgi:hypothetical protein
VTPGLVNNAQQKCYITLNTDQQAFATWPVSVYYVIFEVFTAITMKNNVFWDIKTDFVPHRKHSLSYRAQLVNAT